MCCPLHAATWRHVLLPFSRFKPISLLDGHYFVGAGFAEAFEIELLNELWQWQLPRLLLMVIDLAQLRRVQAKFSGHLYLAVRQMAALSRVDPCLHFLILLFDILRHTLWHSSRKPDSLHETGRARRALLFLVLPRPGEL